MCDTMELLVKLDVPPVTLPAIPPDATSFVFTYDDVEYEYEKQEDGTWERVNFIYDELDDRAKEKACEWYTSGDHLWYDWWDSIYDHYASEDSFVCVKYEQDEAGNFIEHQLRPYFTPEKIDCFDIDRGSHAGVYGSFDLAGFVESRVKLLEDRIFRNVKPFASSRYEYEYKEKLRRWKRVLIWLTDDTRDKDATIENESIGIAHHNYGSSVNNTHQWDEFQWYGDFDEPDWLAGIAKEIAEDLDEEINEIESEVISALRKEYEWLYSEECVAENIRCNQHTFDKDGNHHG